MIVYGIIFFIVYYVYLYLTVAFDRKFIFILLFHKQ